MNQEAENVDRDEIARFEALAERWWDPDREFRPLHDINPARLRYIEERVGLQGRQILDIGCGGGILAEAMAQGGARVTAIDMAEASLAVARLHQETSGLDVEYVKSTAEDHARARPGAYDVVTCLEMLEHVPRPSAVVAACARLVRPGGQVFFSTINRNARAWLMAIVGAEYVLAGRDTGAATDAFGGVHRAVGVVLGDRDGVGVRRTPGADGDVPAGLDDAVERAPIDDEVLHDGKRRRPPRLDPDLGAIPVVPHMQLAHGRARQRSVRLAVDHEAARATDALTTVVIERDRFLALPHQIIVHNIEQLQKRHVLADIVRDISLERARPIRARLPPDVQRYFHWIISLARSFPFV
jgi:2-polyprenyl-6-hydroxyphenyl methylase/3-demethylubiquinone-9 3-methyltransferase